MILSLENLRHDYKIIYKKNWKMAQRLEALIELTKIELIHEKDKFKVGKNLKISSLVNGLNISKRTLQRWKSSYNSEGLWGVGLKEIKGRKPTELSDEIKILIDEYRQKFRWGAEVIRMHLLLDHDFDITKYKIERYLTTSGMREKYPCTTKKKKIKKKTKHTKKVIVMNPGEHTQMDIKYQIHLLKNKQKAYVYNFIDHASNWSFKKAYERISAKNTKDFMEELLKVCPFKIQRLQTDNGIEFTFKWISEFRDDPKVHPLMRVCHENDIRHKLIPPGEKELQGLVERSHRQDDQELFSRIEPQNLEEFQNYLSEYMNYRNAHRRFKKLNWLTPDQWLENYKKLKEEEKKDESVVKLVA